MRRPTIRVLILIFIFGVLIAFSPPENVDAVNILTGAMDCTSPFWCQHERGHLLDLGGNGLQYWLWKNADPGFELAIRSFLDNQNDQYSVYHSTLSARYDYKFQVDDFGYWFRDAGIRAEIFADIVALSGGYIENMPPAFRPFFAEFEDEIPLLPFEG